MTPRLIAIIPARGGSKGLPGKNLIEVRGRSLIARAVDTCVATGIFSNIIVSTDDECIAREAIRSGAAIAYRDGDLANDLASSESALLHALATVEGPGNPADVVAFIQCTSPFIDPGSLAEAVSKVLLDGADVVFSAAAFHGFVWQDDGPDQVAPINHDRSKRSRRQDEATRWLETGAFYVMRRAGLESSSSRFHGRVAVQSTPSRSAVEIDDADDLMIARALAPLHDFEAPRPTNIQALAMDFDGVHTDNYSQVDQEGNESVSVSRADGHGIALLRRAGLKMAIFSTDVSDPVLARARKLGIPAYNGLDDKVAALSRWFENENLDPSDCMFVGNDENDRECLEMVGWPVIVADAHPSIRASARIVLNSRGGHGAIRELADLILANRPQQTSSHVHPDTRPGKNDPVGGAK